MIISHKHKFIFLHVPKTAGSSISSFFSQYLGDDDILNGWNHPLREGIQYNKNTLETVNSKLGLRMISRAINLRLRDQKLFERPIIDFAFREILKKRLGTNSIHATAKHIKNFDKKSWDNYFKFTFVRNPYTQAISCWMWNDEKWSITKKGSIENKKKLKKQEFIKYLKKLKRKIGKDKSPYYQFKIPGNKIYTINNKIAVDFIGKFENLNEDITKIQKILKLPKEKLSLKHTKLNTKKNYLKYYSKESKSLVEEIWEKEFQFFDYKFPKNK
tara:strand:+ start:42 stop:857 length:816 start_codon:yes stop_codon:yes gene_type:complete